MAIDIHVLWHHILLLMPQLLQLLLPYFHNLNISHPLIFQLSRHHSRFLDQIKLGIVTTTTVVSLAYT